MDFDPLPPPPPYTPSLVSSKQSRMHRASNPQTLLRKPMLVGVPRGTNPITWCIAVFCLLFSLLLICFGIATLVIFLNIKPRSPAFDAQAASLRLIYFDSPEFLNGEFTVLANFSNPNKKLEVRFEYLYIQLYFQGSPMASQVIQPFRQHPGEVRLVYVNFLSSLVYLPPNVALELQRQEQRNRIVYNIKGKFRVKVKLGLVHYSYWLHGECQIEMTSPPTGVLITHSCRAKR